MCEWKLHCGGLACLSAETPYCFWTVKLSTAEVLNASPFVVLKLRIAMCKGL